MNKRAIAPLILLVLVVVGGGALIFGSIFLLEAFNNLLSELLNTLTLIGVFLIILIVILFVFRKNKFVRRIISLVK